MAKATQKKDTGKNIAIGALGLIGVAAVFVITKNYLTPKDETPSIPQGTQLSAPVGGFDYSRYTFSPNKDGLYRTKGTGVRIRESFGLGAAVMDTMPKTGATLGRATGVVRDSDGYRWAQFFVTAESDTIIKDKTTNQFQYSKFWVALDFIQQ